MRITRRQFGGFAAALPFAAPAPGTIVGDPEVVVVGAGAAGIGAAATLIAGGRRVQVVEAAPRIGGRCHTDTATFGTPFDRGAAWLHNAERNPLTGLARLHGFETVQHDAAEVLFSGGVRAEGANGAYERAYVAVSDALSNAAEQGEDVAAASVQPLLLDDGVRAWAATAAAHIGPLNMGVDFAAMSVKEWFDLDEDEPNRLVREGLGTLVARLGGGLPIAVNTRVQGLQSVGGGVRVATDRGMLSARAAIVTVSAGVLLGGGLAFDPPFDSAMHAGLGGLQMGLLTKIALAFEPSSAALAFPKGSTLVPQVTGERGHYFLMRPLGAPLAICFVGGSLAWDLATQSEATNVAFARDRLRALIGSHADRGFRVGTATSWGTNPLTRGAYAASKPGHWKARQALNTPIGERIFLAGEALAGKAAQTVHGAYESGRRAARRVQALLKR